MRTFINLKMCLKKKMKTLLTDFAFLLGLNFIWKLEIVISGTLEYLLETSDKLMKNWEYVHHKLLWLFPDIWTRKKRQVVFLLSVASGNLIYIFQLTAQTAIGVDFLY